MRTKDTVFFRGKQAINIDFKAEKISTDGAYLLVIKLNVNIK
jgi:hypothetical protein